MKKNKNDKLVKRECNFCAANFDIWLSNLNYDEDRKESIKERFYRYCPVCIVSEKSRKKGRL